MDTAERVRPIPDAIQSHIPARPFEGISEFGLSAEMHELAVRFNNEFLTPYRAKAKLIEEKKASAQEAIEKSTARRQKVISAIDKHSSKIRSQLEVTRRHCETHRVKFSTKIVPNRRSNYISSTDADSDIQYKQAERLAAQIDNMLPAVMNIVPDKFLFWPRESTRTAAFWTSGIVGFLIAILLMNTRLTTFFPALLWSFLSIYALFTLLANSRLKLQVANRANNVRDAACDTESFFAAWLQHADSQWETAKSLFEATIAVIQGELEALHKQFASLGMIFQDEFAAFSMRCASAASDWNSPAWQTWKPDDSPEFAAQIGRFIIDADTLNDGKSLSEFHFELPALVPFADKRCLTIYATEEGDHKRAGDAIRSLLLRALANTPPGKMRFTFIDPMGLGQNVAAFMALGKEHDQLIHGRAWSESHHIEQRLAELTEHIETVIQKFLQVKYTSIQDYNSNAGEIAEPFRILVVFDFPTNFSDSSTQRLLSIIRNGPRCGVYTIVMANRKKPMPYGLKWSELERNSLIIDASNCEAVWREEPFDSIARVKLDSPPNTELFSRIIETAASIAKSAMKVEVSFDRFIAKAGLSPENLWKGSTIDGIRIPLGPTGARDIQELVFGEGSTHHALVVGRTGSGKTNLMHVAIASLALKYSPNEITLYLIDFKGGVGFKIYAEHRLPHARAIAIESEREFGMSLLDELDAEMTRRADLFRAAGASDLGAFRRKNPKARLPRIFLLVDEFQEFFVDDDVLSQRAKQLFERLVRQGRGFGVHILLGTQSLSGSATLPTATLGQIGVRIALQCSETDAAAILAPDNKEARLLSRPGEAVYNSAAGLIEGNSRFQAAMLPDELLATQLSAIAEKAVSEGIELEPIIFEGNAPVRLSECKPLNVVALAGDWPAATRSVSLWLGDSVSLRPPAKVNLTRQSGRHLVVVTRDEAAATGSLLAAWVSLLVQHRPTTASFYILDFTTSDTPWAGLIEEMVSMFAHQAELLTRRTLQSTLIALVDRIKAQQDSDSRLPQVDSRRDYLLIFGLHRARDLKEDESRAYSSDSETPPASSELLATILRDGPEAGIHVLAWSDTYPNASRALGRSLNEFGIRLAGMMSADDSRSFLDDAAASRLDKPFRAILSDDERPGVLDKIRPYAIPDKAWLAEIAGSLNRRK
jgi:hypothetical protein